MIDAADNKAILIWSASRTSPRTSATNGAANKAKAMAINATMLTAIRPKPKQRSTDLRSS